MKQRLSLQLAAPLLALAFALVVSAVILMLADYAPGDVLRVVMEDGFRRQRMVDTINRAGP